MYTLLIADDEQEIREGLSKLIPWAELGFELKAKLQDGREAIDYLKRMPVDAILTDIKMSVVSGIGVAKYVYEHALSTKVVLLSGYKEFALAHDAIKYNVKHYLLKPSNLSEIVETFKKIKRELDEEPLSPRSGTTAAAPPAKGVTTTANPITMVKEYIHREYHRDLSLKEVAEHVCLNPVYLSRLFKEQTNENFSDYLTHVRIEKAKALLIETPHKVYEICEQIGYKNIQHFHKLFKAKNGLTPSDYRKKFD